MLNISADDVDSCLDHAGLIETLRRAFRQGAVQPVRHHHTVERPGASDATLLLMPAWNDFSNAEVGNGYIGVKIATVSPDNNAIGKPAVMAVYLLMDGRTGEPLALIDGQRVTAWRTACASGLATSYLARQDASRLLIVGAGALAPHLARAHSAVRPITEIRIWNRSSGNAQKVVDSLNAAGMNAAVAGDLDEAVAEADIVSCATLSNEPLVRGAVLKPGTHVDLIGAFTPTMRESDDEAVRRASVFVDTRAGAVKEAGDIVQALKSGALKEEEICADLYELTRGDKPGRRSDDEITLFKSVGAAIEDLAAGIAVYEKHRA
ncbi:ornithine cyclodeaminase family protein [Nitratireductor indicus]|uniref:Ornithine cyclodeaminase n=1 Tax=Nitratireductor indicus C115 TaxID=1231190 RepID=K2N9X0_9HYPH|nr:ornithine cyclodeaminase family protein [Nitratireductor indicus]EKF44413.1 ornithine cyclodeaminase [Nitratireductor indicus C115]MDS1137366.1 ornithine cyclodeaminase family protein [Nitratireductor indicus]SFQ28993.1 ornithine cyclodeaminase [Nitratireductor indicus]